MQGSAAGSSEWLESLRGPELEQARLCVLHLTWPGIRMPTAVHCWSTEHLETHLSPITDSVLGIRVGEKESSGCAALKVFSSGGYHGSQRERNSMLHEPGKRIF